MDEFFLQQKFFYYGDGIPVLAIHGVVELAHIIVRNDACQGVERGADFRMIL